MIEIIQPKSLIIAKHSLKVPRFLLCKQAKPAATAHNNNASTQHHQTTPYLAYQSSPLCSQNKLIGSFITYLGSLKTYLPIYLFLPLPLQWRASTRFHSIYPPTLYLLKDLSLFRSFLLPGVDVVKLFRRNLDCTKIKKLEKSLV